MCDFCREKITDPSVQVVVHVGPVPERRSFLRDAFGTFCSRFCAIHALTASVSRDLASGAARRVWRGGELVDEALLRPAGRA